MTEDGNEGPFTPASTVVLAFAVKDGFDELRRVAREMEAINRGIAERHDAVRTYGTASWLNIAATGVLVVGVSLGADRSSLDGFCLTLALTVATWVVTTIGCRREVRGIEALGRRFGARMREHEAQSAAIRAAVAALPEGTPDNAETTGDIPADGTAAGVAAADGGTSHRDARSPPEDAKNVREDRRHPWCDRSGPRDAPGIAQGRI